MKYALLALVAWCFGCEGRLTSEELAVQRWTEVHGEISDECLDAVHRADVRTVPENELAETCEAEPGQLLGCMYGYDEGQGSILMAEDATDRDVAHELIHVIFACYGLRDTPANHDHRDMVWQ